jgi:hypothetical protein
MRERTVLICLLFVSVAHSQTHKHMVMIHENGLGGISRLERFIPEGDSIFRDYDIISRNFKINYSYAITSRWQIGTFLSNYSQTRNVVTQSRHKGSLDTRSLLWGVHILYNFSSDLLSTWVAGLGGAYLNHEEEYDKKIQNFLEDDRKGYSLEMILMRRMNLRKWGVQNISYSPALTVFVMNSSKDYADDRIKFSWGLSLHFIKFDVFF